jgi:hypothetical protein
MAKLVASTGTPVAEWEGFLWPASQRAALTEGVVMHVSVCHGVQVRVLGQRASTGDLIRIHE